MVRNRADSALSPDRFLGVTSRVDIKHPASPSRAMLSGATEFSGPLAGPGSGSTTAGAGGGLDARRHASVDIASHLDPGDHVAADAVPTGDHGLRAIAQVASGSKQIVSYDCPSKPTPQCRADWRAEPQSPTVS